MKYLIMTEGPTDKAFIEVLIKKRLFKCAYEDMLDERIFHARQIKGQLVAIINTLPPGEKISVLRIGDKLKDRLKVPKEIEHRVEDVRKYCTKPEFEILLIINEGLFATFSSQQNYKAKAFAK